MSSHNRKYYRDQRQKHIERKKRIIKALNNYWHYEHEGMLSKGKIHCGCGMCRRKTNNRGKHRLIHGNYAKSKDWKCSDKRKIEKMNAAVAEYWKDITGLEELSSYIPAPINPFNYYDYELLYDDYNILEKMIESLQN